MSFSSLFFVICFLPVFLLVYLLVPGISRKNAVLLLFSVIFYIFSGVAYLFLAAGETMVIYLAALRIGRESADADDRKRKRVLTAALIIIIALLVFFKFGNFFTGPFIRFFNHDWKDLNVIMPLGISFYTFKLISYIVDVYWRKILPEKSFFILFLYVIVFHTISQGPIVRFADVRKEFFRRKSTMASVTHGIQRFCVGLAMKTVLADRCGEIADALIPQAASAGNVTTAGVWLGSLFFSLQMYLDFAAYSHMAIALGEMTGFHYRENFNYPYISVSVKDFWRRWHISLSSFFRDYVYIPLGGNRVSEKRRNVNVLAVWILTGIWHGNGWNFLIWGLMYFAFITAENYMQAYIEKMRATRKKQRERAAAGASGEIPEGTERAAAGASGDVTDGTVRADGMAAGKAAGVLLLILRHIYTIFVFNLGWVIFRFTDLSRLGTVLRSMFGFSGSGAGNITVQLQFENNIFIFILCVLACTPVFSKLDSFLDVTFEKKKISKSFLYGAQTVITVLFFVVSVAAMAGSSYRPFLYNQF